MSASGARTRPRCQPTRRWDEKTDMGTSSLDESQLNKANHPGKTNFTPTNANGTAAVQGASGNGSATAVKPGPWSLADAVKLYNINQWGQGYFSINEEGHVAVHPTQDQ